MTTTTTAEPTTALAELAEHTYPELQAEPYFVFSGIFAVIVVGIVWYVYARPPAWQPRSNDGLAPFKIHAYRVYKRNIHHACNIGAVVLYIRLSADRYT